MKKSLIRRCLSGVFFMLIAVFFLCACNERVAALPTPPDDVPIPESKGGGDYIAWHHSAVCIGFIEPLPRMICVNRATFPHMQENEQMLSQTFLNMLVLRHDNAAIPPTSWLRIEQGIDSPDISVSLSDGYNEPYTFGRGKTFSEAMENLYFNFFHLHREKKSLSRSKP